MMNFHYFKIFKHIFNTNNENELVVYFTLDSKSYWVTKTFTKNSKLMTIFSNAVENYLIQNNFQLFTD
jgi:hypothetical protein